jgi:hypothetical protein
MGAEVQLADLFNIFVNRERELARLDNLMVARSGVARIQIVKAGVDCGLTSAIRRTIKARRATENLVYFNARDPRPAALFEYATASILEKGQQAAHDILLPLVRPEKKEILTRLFSSGLKAIPFVGETISDSFAIATDWFAEKADTGEYNAKVNSLFDALCKSGRTIIVADHFQHATEHQVTQVANLLYTLENVALLIGQNTPDKSLARQTVDEKLSMFGSSILEFPDPDTDLAQKIIEVINTRHDVHVSFGLSERIHHGMRFFLEGVLDFIARQQHGKFELKQLHKDIICLLRSATEPIPHAIIFDAIVENSLFIADSVLFDAEVEFLCQMGLVGRQHGSESAIHLMLSRWGEEIANGELENSNLRLYYSTCLYRSIDRALSQKRFRPESVALLMYRLSSLVDERRSSYWSVATVRSCMATSNFAEANQVLAQIKSSLPQTREDDILTIVAACVATKRYAEGLGYLEKMERQPIRIRILKSILLYRCMRLERALSDMEGIWRSGVDGNDACLLATFFIGLCIDLGKQELLRGRIEEWRVKFRRCRSYGYFLNIVAATRSPAESVELCAQSLPYFRKGKDRFGYGGASANIGVHCIKLGEYKRAIRRSVKAHETLAKFGIQHVHLVANNLGCANLMLGQYGESRMWLQRCLTLAQTSTVRVHALTNLAAVNACTASKDMATMALRSAIDESSKNPIVHVMHTLTHNTAVVCAIADLPLPWGLPPPSDMPNEFESGVEFVDAVRTAVDQVGPLASLRRYYRPPTNQYWYPNPMDLFEEKRLSSEADVEDGAYG